MYRISSLEGQLRHCQNKLTESHRKFEAELVKQHLSTRDTLETIQKEHEFEMSQARLKIELLEKNLAEMEKEKADQVIKVIKSSPTTPVPSGPPSLQPKSPSRRKKRLKKGDSLTPNASKSELIPLTSPPTNEKTASSDTNILSFKDRPKSSSYGDLTKITKGTHSSDSKLVKTPQLSPTNPKRNTENRPSRRESGEKLTITALVAESLAYPGSISVIRKELKSDAFTPKIQRKFQNRSPGTSSALPSNQSPGTSSALPSMSPKNGMETGEGKEGKSPLTTHRNMLDRLKGNSSVKL